MSRQTVVVVEDEPVQRMDAAAAFAAGGFETAEFDNADDAAAYVRDHEDSILAIFTDVRMPGETDGLNFVAQVAFGCPDIALLVTSGQAEGILERLPPNGYFVPKPWLSADLKVAIDHVRSRQSL
jgi:CheY-like chemotaxis protein